MIIIILKIIVWKGAMSIFLSIINFGDNVVLRLEMVSFNYGPGGILSSFNLSQGGFGMM